MKIPFNKPHLTGKEFQYIAHAHAMGQLAGDGFYTKKTQRWFEKNLKTKKSLLTHSCTAALEMMIILAGVEPGDEVILPSFTFTSTANAIVLRGGIPVFIDIRPDTLNMDEKLIEQAITKKTKAIFPVHYAGVSCEMDTILKIARKHNLLVLEDAAQGFLAQYKGKNLGTIGDLGALSFHETKNVISGEGGALLINKHKFIQRAEIIREKGTNRSQFFRGQVDKYTWVDIGSSYLPGEVIAALLAAQLEKGKEINRQRVSIWKSYHKGFEDLEKQGVVRRPVIPQGIKHNGHLYYLLLDSLKVRTQFLQYMKSKKILSVFHYIPLHSSPAGKKFGRPSSEMSNTDRVSQTLVRIPLFFDLSERETEYIIKSVKAFFK